MRESVKREEATEQLERNQQWWWLAEKARSKRLDYLRKAVWKKGVVGRNYAPGTKIDLTFPQLFTEAWKEHEGEPIMLRKAHALAYVLDKIPLFITDHAQLVGYVGSAPHEMVWHWQSASMINEELYNERGIIPEEEEKSLRTIATLNDYWGGQTALDRLVKILDPEDLVKFMSGAIGWGIPSSAVTYATKDFAYIFKGFEAIIDEIDSHVRAEEEKIHGNPCPEIIPLYDKFYRWEAMRTMLAAGIRYARRYARLARIVAEYFEKDPKRKEELLRIAETCEHVPAKPPRNLQESLQFDHFVQVLSRYETFEGAWPHRPDYIHAPYYNKDVDTKRLTKEEALDLVGEHMIRTYEVGIFAPRWAREGVQGITGTWLWTIGGVNPDGTDACNDLTIAYMEAALLVRVGQSNLWF